MPSPQPLADTRSLVIKNQASEIRRLGEWLDSVFRQLDLPADLRFRLNLCAEEAITNTITHAFPENGMHEIFLRLSVDKPMVWLEIKDDGIPFNPLDAPQHVQPTSIEEASIGGLGIPLMRSLMDQCTYERVGGNNVLTMAAAVPSSHTSQGA